MIVEVQGRFTRMQERFKLRQSLIKQGRISRGQSRLNVQSRIKMGRLNMQGRFVIGLSRRIASSCQDRQRSLKTSVATTRATASTIV